MLVLSRKLGEKILVPACGVVVTVVAIEGNRVRLGISAPAEVNVFREEIWRQLCQESLSPPAKGSPSLSAAARRSSHDWRNVSATQRPNGPSK